MNNSATNTKEKHRFNPSAVFAEQSQRLEIVDALRGAAIVLMIIFHFCFLLRELQLAFLDFYQEPFWRYFRTIIVVMFLTIVGVSLSLSVHGHWSWQRYLRRLGQILLYAMAISVATYLYAPERVVIIGILHFIAIASVLGLMMVRMGWLNLLLGSLAILVGVSFSAELFNRPALHWLGLMTHKPITLDYVPILPWIGVVLIGLYIGELFSRLSIFSPMRRWQNHHKVTRLLVLMGRHSLTIYMLHVPILYALIYLYSIS